MLLLIKSGVVIMNHASANWNRELRAPAARPPLLARTSVLVLYLCLNVSNKLMKLSKLINIAMQEIGNVRN